MFRFWQQLISKVKCLMTRYYYIVNSTGAYLVLYHQYNMNRLKNEPVHEISNNVLYATSKASDQPGHMRSLIRAFASRLSIL